MNGDKPGYRTGNLADTDGEAGAMDNLLQLNIGDDRWKEALDAWKDGEKYMVDLEIQQVSPGKFKVLSMKSDEHAETDVNAEANERASEKSSANDQEETNPAVENLMASGERR